ncbi:MAG TPA: hypothetical protein PK308_07095 [Phycisphaerales bacterium]|nr:hypothetical protein [Phycisphaerales bacterium]
MSSPHHAPEHARTPRARRARLVGALAVAGALAGALLGGCNAIQTTDGTKIRRNMPVERVPGKFGPPDIVGQQTGEQRRYYFLDEPPADAWDAEDLRTFYYYTGRGYKLVITDGRVRSSESISTAEFDEILPRIRARREQRGE